MKKKRLACIDLLRGAAILIMILANSSPYLLSPSYPFLYRMISSLAAPVFLFLSGYSLAYTFHYKNDAKDKIIQAVYLLLSASLLDALVWHICPFQTFDVLYCIGAGILINTFLINIRPVWSAALILLLFLALWIVQPYLYYRMNIPETPIGLIFSDHSLTSMKIDFGRIFVDGWFPLFPWIIFPVSGALLFRWQTRFIKYRSRIIWISGLLVLVACFPFYFLKSGQPLRKDYVELFYSPDISYVFFAISIVLFLFSVLYGDKTYNKPVLNQIRLLGRQSLFVYLLHAVIISYIFQPFFPQTTSLFFSLIMLIFWGVLTMAAQYAESLKRQQKLNFIPGPLRRLCGLL
jgi:uncharacterized membrane protein